MRLLTILIFLSFFAISSNAQVNLNQIFNAANSALGNGLSNADITKGLKEALIVGSKNAGNKASALDGFYRNSKIMIPFPAEANDMKMTLNRLGMQKQISAFEKQLNRAAEDAAKKAAPIFMNAITSLTINDGISILRGNNDEATQYLKRTTSSKLSNEFKPIIATSLKKVDITCYWKPLIKKYNKVPFVKKVNPNLEEYVTQKAIEGLFKLVAEEELKIRTDPSARINDILKKVFGR